MKWKWSATRLEPIVEDPQQPKLKKRSERIAEMETEIRRRGGILGGRSGLPPALYEAFLQSLIDCPDCQDEDVRKRGH